MNVTIEPSRLSGTVAAPPSKSDAHRLLICAGLADGTSRIRGVALSKDIRATLDCLTALGASWEEENGTVTVHGIGGTVNAPGAEGFCNECGSTLRFFLPIFLLGHDPMVLTGSKKLFSRPLGVYETLCVERGLLCRREEDRVTVCGPLPAGEYTVPGNISSQFISGLLFALPLLPETGVITVTEPFESRPYVEMTVHTLRLFGIEVRREGCRFIIPGGQRYRPAELTVEGDWSNAAFWHAARMLGHDVTVTGTDPESLQGDRVCVSLFEKLKAGHACADLSDCPDLAPVLFGFSGACHGGTFTGTARLKLKESDRVLAMQDTLSGFGITLEDSGTSVEVTGSPLRRPAVPLSGHNDHRIVMALSVLMTLTGGTVLGAEAVQKSYPDFFRDLEKLGGLIHYEA